jgi:hypothetical protein
MGVPAEKEWKYFSSRESSLLKPDYKPRDPLAVEFPFSDHPSTKPVLEARLDRKSTVLKRRQPAYYVLTPSGYLHEYKESDPVANPDPTLSLKLADCDLGNPPAKSGKAGFTIKGKDAGKSFGGMTHEYAFRTDSMEEATKWWEKVHHFIGGVSPVSPIAGEETDEESPVSPVRAGTGSATATTGQHAPAATQGLERPHASATTGQGGHTHATAPQTATAPQGVNERNVPVTATVPATATATAHPAQTAAQTAAVNTASNTTT